jgi:thioredoxin 2
MAHAIDADESGLLVACGKCGTRNRMNYARLAQVFGCGTCHEPLDPPGVAVEVHSESIFDAIIPQSALPVLVDFWAPWCAPCRMVAPELEKIAQEGARQWLVIKVNTEELPMLAERFQITGIPLLALFKGGQEIARQTGAMPVRMIREFVQRAWQHGQ